MRAEFFSRHLQQRREDAGAHVAVRNDDRDDVVVGDFDPVGEKPFARLGGEPVAAPDSAARPQRVTDDQGPRCRRSAEQDLAPGDHVRTPAAGEALAANALTAARIRVYVPQRQMFETSVPSSSSVGAGLPASSALTAMMTPDWQYPHCGT